MGNLAESTSEIEPGRGKLPGSSEVWRRLLLGSAVAVTLGYGVLLFSPWRAADPRPVMVSEPIESGLRLDYNFSHLGTRSPTEKDELTRDSRR